MGFKALAALGAFCDWRSCFSGPGLFITCIYPPIKELRLCHPPKKPIKSDQAAWGGKDCFLLVPELDCFSEAVSQLLQSF